MKWWKEHGWILGIILAVAVIFVIVFSFLGNPVSLFLAQRGAEAYVQEHFPELEVTNVGYDFIAPRYYARVENGDADFSIYMDGWGHVYFDTHE